MVKDIIFEKDVVKTTHFIFKGISTEFMDYKRYRLAREIANMSIQTNCFCCDERFKDEEKLSLLFNGNKTNELCCEKCSVKLIESEGE